MQAKYSAKQRLFNAFFELLKTRRYNKIGVSDIVKTAGVNRSTFYRNFEDVFDLYKTLCRKTTEEALSYNIGTIDAKNNKQIAVEMIENAKKKLPQFALLCGKNGSMNALFDLRNTYYDKLVGIFEDASRFNEAARQLCCSSADYMLLWFYVTINDMEGDSGFKLPDADWNYDFGRDPIENLSGLMGKCYGGSSEVQTNLILSCVRLFNRSGKSDWTISDFLRTAGYSRAQFYLFFRSRDDYFRRLEAVLGKMTAASLVPCLFSSEPRPFDAQLTHWKKYQTELKRNTILKLAGSSYLLDLGIKVIRAVYMEFSEELEKRRGKEFIEKNKDDLMFYLSSVMCSFVYFVVDGDNGKFYERLHNLNQLREYLAF